MRTDTSFVVVSREPALPHGMRHFSKATKGVLAALAVMLVSFGASAVAGDGPYVGIGGSLSILNDSNVTAPMREPFSSLNANATTKKRVCRERHGRFTPFPADSVWRPRSTTASTIQTKWMSVAPALL